MGSGPSGVYVPTKMIKLWSIAIGPTTRFTLHHTNTDNTIPRVLELGLQIANWK